MQLEGRTKTTNASTWVDGLLFTTTRCRSAPRPSRFLAVPTPATLNGLSARSRPQTTTKPSELSRRCLGRPSRPHYSAAVGGAQADKQAEGQRWSVYVAKVPLVGLERLSDILGPLYPRQLRHCLTLLVGPFGECRAYDFLPLDPTSPLVVSRMLSGRSTPGELRSRKLRGVPSRNAWFVGEAVGTDPFQAAEDFNRGFNPAIRLVANDCRTHTNLLVEHLTGKSCALEDLP